MTGPLLTLLPDFWAAPQWTTLAAGCVVVLLALLVWSWMRSRVPVWVRLVAGTAKALAVALLALVLLEPMRSETLPRPQANLFHIVADNSQSLNVRDRAARRTRAQQLQQTLQPPSDWQSRLERDFDLRRYLVDQGTRRVADFSQLSATGDRSSIIGSLRIIASRYRGRPHAGILLLTDGNATDVAEDRLEFDDLPPVYPVILGDDQAPRDIRITRLSTSQTNFEAAPVTVVAEVAAHGYAGQTIVVELLDLDGEPLQTQRVRDAADDHPFALRFQIKPDRRGVLFYQVRVYLEGTAAQFESPQTSDEATLANNSRLVMVDRGGGPYRVLYVTGRPNWEFKFLRRALSEDVEVELVGLVRIAKREPKFTFRSRSDNANRLFRNLGEDAEQVEQYDEPVLIRLGTSDEEELRDGFPIAADQLFRYHALVLDDLEAEFFTQDQKALLQQFVSQRGGGFLMLGGQESFVKGGYARTSIGEMLPVYVDRGVDEPLANDYRLVLTREGWLESWVRVRATEEEESQRLARMIPFQTINRVNSIKPGARVLSRVRSADGVEHPALVVQNFGKGRAAALLIGDLWRWQLHRESAETNDLAQAWRQTCRWLVANVPQRIEVETSRKPEDPLQPVILRVKAHDELFRPLDNATVTASVHTPDGRDLELTGEPADAMAGQYVVTVVPRTPGPYHATIRVTGDDGSEVGVRETGWVTEPAAEEFRDLRPNRELLERAARETGGELVPLDRLDAFVSTLRDRKIPITERRVKPLWHSWTVLLCAVGLLVAEWGLRRWKGLP